MGSFLSVEEPPPVVLVPPLFHRPDLSTRYRMAESSYDMLFGKVARKMLFADHYAQADDELITRIMLKPPEDPNVDFTATFSAASDKGIENFNGEAKFRWQRDVEDSNNFMEVDMSTLTKCVKLRSCTFEPVTGLGAFSTLSILPVSRFLSEGENIIGCRYGSSNLSFGTTLDLIAEGPSCAWLVGKLGKITAGCQCKLKPCQLPGEARRLVKKHLEGELGNSKNWSFAVDYGSGKTGPLNPGFNFSLEARENSKVKSIFSWLASFWRLS